MRRNARLLQLAALMLLWPALMTTADGALEPKTWDYGGAGRWPLSETSSTRPIENATLDRAESLLTANQSGDALSVILEWVKNPKNSKAPDRDRALFLLAEAYYQKDDRFKAFYHLDELEETYPASRFFYAALQKQYSIADSFLKGYKRKFLGLRLLSATDEGIDILFRIQERAPGSPLAERALLRTADYYFNTSQFDFAGDAYAAYLRSYPRSPDVPRVRLRQAFSSYAQFHGVQFDATPLIDARAQFEDIKVRYPELAAEANVQKFIDTINESLAKKLYTNADFYRRTSRPLASAYTLRQLIQTYPNSRDAQKAQGDLKALPASAVAQSVIATSRPAEPPAGPPTGSPSTQPLVLPGPRR